MNSSTNLKAQAPAQRGRRALYNWRDLNKSITDILEDPSVVAFLENGNPMTYASLREKARRLLRNGTLTPEAVVASQPAAPAPPQRDTLYGSQRRRADLPKKTTRGDVIYDPDPEPQPRPAPRIPKPPSARQALDNNPTLRQFLQPNRQIKPESLRAKYRRYFKLGKIPGNVLNSPSFTPEFRLKNRALDDTVFTMIIDDPRIRSYDPTSFFKLIKPKTVELLNNNRGYKVFATLKCRMIKTNPLTGEITVDEETPFHSKTRDILRATNLDELYDEITAENLKIFIKNQRKEGSGWRLHHIISYELKFSQYTPLNGSSYVPLPDILKNKEALINMKNEEQECFKVAPYIL